MIAPIIGRISRRGVYRATRTLYNPVRSYSNLKERVQNVDQYLRKIGDEKTKESTNTIYYMRRIGSMSVLVVLGSLVYASWSESQENEAIDFMNVKTE
jgi:hypothetical protein